jgi:hypothetical protein
VSDDEVFVLVAGMGVVAWRAGVWYVRLGTTPTFAAYPGGWRGWLGVAPIACLIGVFFLLRTAASFDVRESPDYLFLYVLLGAAWIFLVVPLMSAFGISVRDDAVHRRNPAAAILIIGAMAGQAAVYSGGNVGDGPGWWVVVAAVLVAGTAWFALWWVVETICKVAEDVTVGRDVTLAIRMAGYMLALGMICGRGVAGDWVSFAALLTEFSDAWPALLLTGAAIGIEAGLRGTAIRKSKLLAGAVAVAYVAAAGLAIAASPPLSANSQFRDAAPNPP